MYTKHGYSEEALLVFIGFLKGGDGGVRPDVYSLSSVICACTQLGGGNMGEQMHGFVIKSSFDRDVYVATSLANIYAKIGRTNETKLVFDGLVVKTAIARTMIINRYLRSGKSDVSLKLFNQMGDWYLLTYSKSGILLPSIRVSK